MSRLKSYNLGAVLPLRLPEELLIAHYFPTNDGVHMAKLIVGTIGEFEFAEYLIRPPEPQQFIHRTGQLPERQMAQLRVQLAALAEREQTMPLDDGDVDFGDYEEPQRRLIRYGNGDRELRSSLPTPQFFVDAGLGAERAAAFREAFEEAWSTLADIIATARGAAPVSSDSPSEAEEA